MRKHLTLIIAIVSAAALIAVAAYVLHARKKPAPRPGIVPCNIPPCDPRSERPCIAPEPSAPCPMPL
jgi:hypothetical protein